MTPIVLKDGRELVLYLKDDTTGQLVRIASALNLPDTKLSARGQINRLLHAVERLSRADVKEHV